MYRHLVDQESHDHSLITLGSLLGYHDFIESIGTVLDIGCGKGHDLHWWATLETAEDTPKPLNIKCTGIDLKNQFDSKAFDRPNITVVEDDMEDSKLKHNSFDVINAHNVLQYALNPIHTLGHWYDLCRDNGMLIISVPESTTLERNRIVADQYGHEYYHWSLVNLMHMLAVNGWDCRDGFFKKERNDPWIHAAVYKTPDFKKLDYRTTTWFDLAELNMLPESAVNSINQWNFVRFQDLKLDWLDKRTRDFRNY